MNDDDGDERAGSCTRGPEAAQLPNHADAAGRRTAHADQGEHAQRGRPEAATTFEPTQGRQHLGVLRIEGEHAVPDLQRSGAATGRELAVGGGDESRGEARGQRFFVARGVGEVAAELGPHLGQPRVRQVRTQVSVHRDDVGIAILGPMGEGAGHDARQVLVDAAAGEARVGKLPFGDPPQHFVGVLAGEGELSGGEQVKHDPHREDVGAEIDPLPLDDFRRHVGRRSEELSRHGHAGEVQHLRDAEVHQLHQTIPANHDVLGLDVAMDDADPVRVAEGATVSAASSAATSENPMVWALRNWVRVWPSMNSVTM